MSPPLTVVTWKWAPNPGYRSTFKSEHVNVLARMVRRHYAKPLRVLCITDDAKGIADDIDVLPLWKDLADLQSPHGRKYPACYRRLRMFSAEAAEFIGPRFISMDLDCVVTGDLSPIFDRPEPFVAWGKTHPTTHYNGSLMMMDAGVRRQVWDTFDPLRSPKEAMRKGQRGSDQGWISACLGPGEAEFGKADGVYSYRNDIREHGRLPPDARLVIFHGDIDPWAPAAQSLKWVKEHWR